MIYTDLDAWKEARILVKLVYTSMSKFPKDEIFALQSQIKRAAISFPSNIAEGSGRNYSKDSLQFFYIARGSAYELETQFYLSFDLNFIDKETLDTLLNQLEKVRRLLAGLINYYKSNLTK
ncbi:four helix bundle protein [Mucilaginibacter lappiensis]|uniref:Four helix bundle protein n=2 Tax=Mucilaginibacter lappiensis TaxID=354630 RepID=A0ABR6PF57_9SPHI|nr:four helix bundle protein [Mucilaginibacter lappiensis]MBB6108378.1 four helix bundle protein [Mucilaginibacter lappiensis]SIQ40107.1 four helix bundle protein [Mucilaginibacter lappiensis]